MSTLTDRYIAEVVRHLPEPQRDDIASEISATVEDMVAAELDSRGELAAGASPDDDVPASDAGLAERAVLARLGDPASLARRYSGARQYLIGPGAYPVWLHVLRWLLPIVGVLAALVNGIVYAATAAEVGLGELIGQVIAGVIPALLAVFAAWTIIVALVERSTPEGTPTPFEPAPTWDPVRLEAQPGQPESRVKAVVSLVLLAILAASPFVPSTFLYIGHLNDGESLVNPAIPAGWLAGYLLLIGALALIQMWLFLRPAPHLGRLTVEVATDVVFGVFLTALVLSQDLVIHPDLVNADPGDTATMIIRWCVVAAIWAVVARVQVETLRTYRRAVR